MRGKRVKFGLLAEAMFAAGLGYVVARTASGSRSLLLLFVLVAVPSGAWAEENASNPLAAVNNTDPRLQYLDLGEAEELDAWIEGAYMVTPKLKLKYEVHYVSTDVTGSSESGWESFRLKPIYLPKRGSFGAWHYSWAVGLEWIVTFDNTDRGIGCGPPPPGEFECRPRVGAGSDQLAPLVGLSLAKGTWVVVPLVQQFLEYSGPPVNQTAVRVIAIKSLPNKFWLKLDAAVPFDWENDTVPASAETQLGRMMTSSAGLYVDGLIGIGGDRPFDWGVAAGLRLKY